MNLSLENLAKINAASGVELPGAAYFELPEKVLQFGTGVLLRGLPDFFIDKANKQGVFNGRVVVVKSTTGGGADAFAKQDGLFTICVRGVEKGETVDTLEVNASISRVVDANTDWQAILECAANPEMSVVISNTTELGIVFQPDSIHDAPPASFPAKLLSFLYKRYQVFEGDPEKGVVIIPTELINENARQLKEIVLKLAAHNQLDASFIDWLESANDFCNSLVDRIVPGKLTGVDLEKTVERLGYTDDLMIMTEVYRLWAIQTSNERTREKLSFSKVDAGMVLAPDIHKFKELKLRLLNGSHTFTCAYALFKGFTTVKEAMADASFRSFITGLMQEEIIPAIITDDLTQQEAADFSAAVLDRYSNPFLAHQWISISFQYSLKMRSRNVDVLKKYVAKTGKAPARMATGFAAYLLFLRSQKQADGSFTGSFGAKTYTITDQEAANFNEKWSNHQGLDLVNAVLADVSLWGESLADLPGFAEAVAAAMAELEASIK